MKMVMKEKLLNMGRFINDTMNSSHTETIFVYSFFFFSKILYFTPLQTCFVVVHWRIFLSYYVKLKTY